MPVMDAVDELIRLESPSAATRLLVIDAPGLVEEARGLCDDVVVWCDDIRQVPDELPDGAQLADRLDDETLDGVDLVWLRLPQGLGALDEYVALVANHASDLVRVVSGGRNKDMTKSQNQVLERHFVEVSASLGRRKARVLHASDPDPRDDEWPKAQQQRVTVSGREMTLTVVAHGLTFAGTKVDAGTRLLLSHLGKVPRGDVVDLGCGNGIITACLGRLGAESLTAVDVSRAACESTLLTAAEAGTTPDVRWSDGLSSLDDASLDAVVTNPPFHQGVAKDSDPTITMLADCARVLRPGGEVWCVFNSHLPWRKVLNQHVGPTTVVDQNPHYTLTRTTARG